MSSVEIPEKRFFKIGEVARLLEVEPYTLRYWETEFEQLRPSKTRTGQRSYQHHDIELLLAVKALLYDEMYTIAGARRQLKLRKKGAPSPDALSEAYAGLTEDHERLRHELSQRTERIRDLETALATTDLRSTRLAAECNELNDRIAQMEEAAASPSGPVDLDTAALRSELDEAKAEIEALRQERELTSRRNDARAQRRRAKLALLRQELGNLSPLVRPA